MRPESSDSAARTELREMVVRLVHSSEQPRYQELMREHHYLGHLPKIGETLWYVASWREQWVALLSFSASALKCAARDRKSTRLNSSHLGISYAVFCLKKKKKLTVSTTRPSIAMRTA